MGTFPILGSVLFKLHQPTPPLRGRGLWGRGPAGVVLLALCFLARSLSASNVSPLFGDTFPLTPTYSGGVGTLNYGVACPASGANSALITANWVGSRTYTLTVTNGAGATATTSVTVTPQVVVVAAVSPATVNLTTGSTQTFTSSVTGAANSTLLWSVDGVTGGNASLGTISNAGLYSTGTTLGAHIVTATAVANGEVQNGLVVVAPLFPSPHLQGTFFTRDTYTDSQWQAAFGVMRAVGMTQAVVNASVDGTAMTTRYPTALQGYSMVYPTLPPAFANAATQNIDVYLGLQSNDDWWNGYSTNPVWLASQAALSNSIADELFSLYGGYPQLKGWYLPFEVDNVTFPTTVEWDMLVAYFNVIVGHLHAISPGKLVVVSPFFNSQQGLDSNGWQAMWTYILSRSPIDVVALQDGVGAGNSSQANLAEWFTATKTAVNSPGSAARLWSDTETFNSVDWSTMPINGLVSDIQTEAPFVSNFLSWSFSDYIDPQSTNPLYYFAYSNYVVNGNLDVTPPSIPSYFTAQPIACNSVLLSWTPSSDNVGVVAYDLTRNGLVTRLYTPVGYSDCGLDGGTSYTYTLSAVDASGNVSAASLSQTVVTPADPVYHLNLALGRPYTTSTTANASHPDLGGGSLTDGLYGSNSAFDPAWQGRISPGNTWVIDLGSVQTVHEINSGWLNDSADFVALPTSVSYSVSVDGVTFTPLGTVTPSGVAPSLWRFVAKLTLMNAQGRFIKVIATTNPGDWNLVDEVEVRQ